MLYNADLLEMVASQQHSSVDSVTVSDLADLVNLADLMASENLAAPSHLGILGQACPSESIRPSGDISALALALVSLISAPRLLPAGAVWADTPSPTTTARRMPAKTLLAPQGVPVSPDTSNRLEWRSRSLGVPIVHTPHKRRATMSPNGTKYHQGTLAPE